MIAGLIVRRSRERAGIGPRQLRHRSMFRALIAAERVAGRIPAEPGRGVQRLSRC
jgi:hypothetical protein